TNGQGNGRGTRIEASSSSRPHRRGRAPSPSRRRPSPPPQERETETEGRTCRPHDALAAYRPRSSRGPATSDNTARSPNGPASTPIHPEVVKVDTSTRTPAHRDEGESSQRRRET